MANPFREGQYRPRIYVAGPYTKGDPLENTLRALQVADDIMNLGAVPFVPHLSHFWHMHYPRPYEDWMTLDFAWLAQCDILFRLVGESPGADREVEFAHELGIPIFVDNERHNGWQELVAYLYDVKNGRICERR